MVNKGLLFQESGFFFIEAICFRNNTFCIYFFKVMLVSNSDCWFSAKDLKIEKFSGWATLGLWVGIKDWVYPTGNQLRDCNQEKLQSTFKEDKVLQWSHLLNLLLSFSVIIKLRKWTLCLQSLSTSSQAVFFLPVWYPPQKKLFHFH